MTGWGGPMYPGWDFYTSMPGMQNAMRGGAGSMMGNYDPRQYTGGMQNSLQSIMGGSQDLKMTSPMKYFNPMQEQAKMSAKGAKNRAISQIQGQEGRTYNPATSAFMGSLFDVMPGQQAPSHFMASGQMAAQENAPKYAYNSAQRGQAMAGATNLAQGNQAASLQFMNQKASLQQNAMNAGMAALSQLMSTGMSSGMNFMMGMMPQFSGQMGAMNMSGRTMPGMNPYDWMRSGQWTPYGNSGWQL